MSKNDEYAALNRDYADTESKKRACENRIAKYNAQLERLYPIKTIISNQKKAFKGLCTKTDDLLDADRTWKGSNYDDFIQKGGWLSDDNVYFRDKSLDHILDSLNNKITEIENKRNNEYGLLGRLASALNSLWNKIENFWN